MSKFSEERCFRALYAPDSNPSATTLTQEILSAPTKVDLITLGRDLSELSTEDVELVRDILSQLGNQDGSPSQGEFDTQGEQTGIQKPIGSREPTFERQPTAFVTAVDTEDEEEEEAQLYCKRKCQPPLTPPFIPSPPTEPYPCLPISPTTAKSPTPPPKSSTPHPRSPTP